MCSEIRGTLKLASVWKTRATDKRLRGNPCTSSALRKIWKQEGFVSCGSALCPRKLSHRQGQNFIVQYEQKERPRKQCRPRTTSLSHLLEQRHGELLVRDAVSGRADVFFGLVCDVEVNPHQDVFLQGTEVIIRTNENQTFQECCAVPVCVRAVLRSTLRRRP